MTDIPAADGAADIADLAANVLLLARRLHAAEADVEGIVQLGGVETLVMHHVDRNPGVSPTAMATAVGLRPSNASAALRSLERHGMVERRKAADDARRIELWATATAHSNLLALRDHWRDILAPHVEDAAAASAATQLLESLDHALATACTGAADA